MDWAKYTDEGWYGDAAIRHFSRGSWYLRGDFNPAAALPVWPILEALLFRFTGVSVVAARALAVAVFGLILLFGALLVARAPRLEPGRSRGNPLLLTAAAGSALLLASSPFCYAFMRMAILEPPLICLTLLALLAASAIDPQAVSPARRALPALATGIVVPLMILTKTTALFLLPAIGWMIWARCGYRPRPFLRHGGLAGATALLLWSGYYLAIVRAGLLLDYRYLFSVNAYTGITRATALSVLHSTLADGFWIGAVPFSTAAVLSLAGLAFRPLRQNPLVISLLLWASGYMAFLAYHANLQPRYYLVVAVPLTLLVPLTLELAWRRTRLGVLRAAVVACSCLMLAVAVRDAQRTLHYVRSPQYTFLAAARQIRQIVAADRSHKPLVLSISGSDLSLMTGIPSICDDFGTMELEERVATYKPGWYASWNQVDDDKMDALAPKFRVERVAAFPAMDDPERNLLILYRLDPATGPRPRRRGLHRPPRRAMLTQVGQQPSSSQLEH